MVSGTFVSARRIGMTCGWSISYPPGSKPGDSLPVVVALHGKDADHSDMFGDHLALDRFLAAHVAAGNAPFAIAAVDAGNSFYHHRTSGEDSGAMIIYEFMPLLAAHGLDLTKLAFLGFSMGGYGSLRIAGALGPSQVKAVAAESMAIWKNPADVPPGLFDSAADYAANTVFGRQAELRDIPVRIDCGLQDALYPEVKAYKDSLTPTPPGVFAPGIHDFTFWRSVAPAQLRFLGQYLA
jgi:S-formylglutathione hydrolase FrmB